MAVGYKAGVLTGLVVSLGAALLGPLWRPAVSRYGRPLAKGAVKQSLAAYEIGRGRMAEFGETVQDLVAEVQVERVTERMRPGGTDTGPVAPGGTGPV